MLLISPNIYSNVVHRDIKNICIVSRKYSEKLLRLRYEEKEKMLYTKFIMTVL